MSEQAVPAGPDLPPQLLAEVAAQADRHVAGDFRRLAGALRSRFGAALDAVILYGSCMRAQDPAEGVVDLYAVVDDYGQAYEQRYLRWLNAWLPPNVFYLELDGPEPRLRCKYAVISRRDLISGCRDWFQPYLWARFAQPVRLLYARDEAAREQVHHALATAVRTFLRATVPALEAGEVDVEELWAGALGLSYATELRPESRGRARRLTHLNMADYSRLTAAALPALADQLESLPDGDLRNRVGKWARRRSRWRWWLRRVQGRLLSVLRLVKAVFTFNNAIEYAAWKIQRHTGVKIEVTPALQRHPILRGTSVLWQLLRRGVLR
jgi:hypothetical protein